MPPDPGQNALTAADYQFLRVKLDPEIRSYENFVLGGGDRKPSDAERVHYAYLVGLANRLDLAAIDALS